jgi:PAS domain-containing protein
LQAIYDGAPVGLSPLDRNLRYVSINRRLADIKGSSIPFYLGRTVKEIFPELYPSIETYLLCAWQGESIQDMEVSWPAGDAGMAAWRTSMNTSGWQKHCVKAGHSSIVAPGICLMSN